jgi:hypothetical protein
MNDSCRSSLRSQLSITTLFAVIFVGLATRTSAQAIPPSATVNRLAHLNDFAKRAGANFEGRLSMGGATMFHLARVRPGLHMEDAARIPAAHSAMAASKARFNAQLQSLLMDKVDIAGSGHGPVPVSDASLDYVLSRFSGFTQSETSSAWCGDNVVVGFNDSGADLRSFVDQVGGRSFANVGVSHNGGKSFVGLPYLNPGPNPADFLAGDPVLVCSSPQHFVYASLYSRNTFDSNGNQTSALTGLAVNHSQDGGLTWGNPIPIVTRDGFLNFVDKEWMAVDSRNPRNVYVTYTDFEIPGTDPLCGSPLGGADILSLSVRLEMVSSHDGGYTWGVPVLIEDDCNLGSLGNLSGTQVAVGPKGQVYVAYTASDADFAEIRFTQSTDGGASFHSVVVVADTTAASAIAVGLEGGFRTTTFPTLAVDNSLGPRRGSIYLTWTDGSHNIIQDLASFVTFAYSFGDIVIASSSDGGSTWSTPKLVSPTPSTFKGRGRDQFMSGMAVDSRGNLAVCYSDRRNDTDNLLIDHYCSLSANGGNTFTDIRQTTSSWSPSHFTDVLVNPAYMGDYDSVSADSTGAQSGFFSSFQIQRNLNPDVFGTRVKLN